MSGCGTGKAACGVAYGRDDSSFRLLAACAEREGGACVCPAREPSSGKRRQATRLPHRPALLSCDEKFDAPLIF